MKTYTASIQNTEDSIRRLMKQHYLAFNKKVLALQIVLCVGGLTIGMMSTYHIVVRMAFLFLGCWVLPFVAHPGREAARQLIKQLDGKFPAMSYTFYETRMLSAYEGKETVTLYSDVLLLNEDPLYFFLFLKDKSCFVVDKSTIRPKEEKAFREALSSACGLEWKKARGLFSMTLPDLMGRKK